MAELGISHHLDDFREQGFDTWETILDIRESDFNAQYTRLDPRQIRILQRVSDDQSSTNTPSYRILPVNVDSYPEFVAVSYVWGEPGLAREINISGKNLKVTNSLYNAVQDVFEALGGLLRPLDSQGREEISL